jgi:hypothetical protein
MQAVIHVHRVHFHLQVIIAIRDLRCRVHLVLTERSNLENSVTRAFCEFATKGSLKCVILFSVFSLIEVFFSTSSGRHQFSTRTELELTFCGRAFHLSVDSPPLIQL